MSGEVGPSCRPFGSAQGRRRRQTAPSSPLPPLLSFRALACLGGEESQTRPLAPIEILRFAQDDKRRMRISPFDCAQGNFPCLVECVSCGFCGNCGFGEYVFCPQNALREINVRKNRKNRRNRRLRRRECAREGWGRGRTASSVVGWSEKADDESQTTGFVAATRRISCFKLRPIKEIGERGGNLHGQDDFYQADTFPPGVGAGAEPLKTGNLEGEIREESPGKADERAAEPGRLPGVVDARH